MYWPIGRSNVHHHDKGWCLEPRVHAGASNVQFSQGPPTIIPKEHEGVVSTSPMVHTIRNAMLIDFLVNDYEQRADSDSPKREALIGTGDTH